VAGAAITPAMLAMNQTWADSEAKRAGRAATASTSSSADAQFLASAAEALVLRKGENADFQGIKDLLMGLEARQNQERAELFNIIRQYAPYTVTENGAGYTTDELMKYWKSGGGMDAASADALLESIATAMEESIKAKGAPKVEVDPQVPINAAELLEAQIGTLTVPVQTVNVSSEEPGYANGIWHVPVDGMIAKLHKGERVVPAREVNSSRNYSSNLYVESMYMNNGQDADALAAKIAAEQRRTSSAHGSR
jgi:hypothetical protein